MAGILILYNTYITKSEIKFYEYKKNVHGVGGRAATGIR